MKGSPLKDKQASSVVSEFEGTLLKEHDLFPYFMLVAFEASGLVRFTLLLIVWPVIRLLKALNKDEAALSITVFVATAGIPLKKIELVGRAVLPKFYIDDVDKDAWRVFSSYKRKVVVTRMPRVMVEWFVKEHLYGDEAIGSELVVNSLGLTMGLVKRDSDRCVHDRLGEILGSEKPSLWMTKGNIDDIKHSSPSISLYQEKQTHDDLTARHDNPNLHPKPVIFHDGRLVKRPTAPTSFMIIIWIPFGILIAPIRIILFFILQGKSIFPPLLPYTGMKLIIKGIPPTTTNTHHEGVLFVLNHRTSLDTTFISIALKRNIPVVSYSASPILQAISPSPTIQLTRNRQEDAKKIKGALQKGDLLICPEGTTCREPSLLRFSALFAELTDRIVPVAMDCKVGLFYATTASGWKAMDLVFFAMNPRPEYRVTFLDQLKEDETFSSGKRSAYEVANDVQRKLAKALGFECTNLTRKDKYRLLAENDGTVSPQ